MKNGDVKANARFKNIIVLMLATCVVIGLVSSTAVRLVTATFMMQSSKDINTGNDAFDQSLNDAFNNNTPNAITNPPAADNNQADGAGDANSDSANTGNQGSSSGDSGNASTPPADDSSSTGDSNDGTDIGTDSGSDDSSTSDDSSSSDGGDFLSGILDMVTGLIGGIGGSGDSGDSGETDEPVDEEPVVDEAEILANNKSAVKNYIKVLKVNKSTASNRPGFTKNVERNLKLDTITSIFQSGVKSEEDVANYLAGETVVVNKGDVTTELGINNKTSACVLGTDDETIKEAVKSSSSQTVTMGFIKNISTGEVVHGYDIIDGETIYKFEYSAEEYENSHEVSAVKLVIVFNDERNPAQLDSNGKTDSFIASVFPVLTGEQIRYAINNDGATTIDVTYTDCSVEMYYNATNSELYSLTQNVNFNVAVKDGHLTLKGDVTDVSKYTGFEY